MNKLIGRKEEIALLEEQLNREGASLIAVYGRRRVGKTYLIRTFFEKHLAFELTGTYNGSLKEQLFQFSLSLKRATRSVLPISPPSSWAEAFFALEQFLSGKSRQKKWVVFFDEFPWLNSRKSGFLHAFEHFWNTWASRQPHIIVVICGSSASWMIRKIVNSKGGLHHRITQKIRLLPFTLAETEEFLRSRGCQFDRHQVLKIYMSLGGIPEYLNGISKGISAAQAIEKICFTRNGLLASEFDNLYRSLFENADHHIAVVKALASSPHGLTRQEIITDCGLPTGGTTSILFEELVESGFIQTVAAFKKKTRDSLYRLTDEFSLFYLKFMEGQSEEGKEAWMKQDESPVYKIWCGMAFEAVCFKHLYPLKRALGIESIKALAGAWKYVPWGETEDRGAQIDLVIDRSDGCINLCEMKCYSRQFSIDNSYALDLERKLAVFKQKTGTRKTLFLTLITTFGLKENMYSSRLVQKSLTMDFLFT